MWIPNTWRKYFIRLPWHGQRIDWTDSYILLNLEVNENHTTNGNESLRCLDSHIWNSLQNQIKKETDYMKNGNDWFGMKTFFLLLQILGWGYGTSKAKTSYGRGYSIRNIRVALPSK